MTTKIYLDVIFFINLCMNFFLLWITSVLSKNKRGIFRLMLSSLILSILYCMTFFFPWMRKLYSIPGSFLLISIGVMVAFGPRNFKEFGRFLCMAYGVSFVVGGICMAFFFATGAYNYLGEGIHYTLRNFPVQILIFSSAACFILLKVGKAWIEANITKRKDFCDVVIYSKGKEIPLRMLIDTGNGLKDPFTGDDVMITSFISIQNLFSRETIQEFLEKKLDDTAFGEYVIQKEREIPFRFIPCASVGKAHGLLLTFRPDKVSLSFGENHLERNDLIVGVYGGEFQGYCGLVNPDTLQTYSLKEAVS